MMKIENYISNILIAVIVVVAGLVVYHNYINEPRIIFQNDHRVKKVSFDKQYGGDFTPIAEKNISCVVYINTIKSSGNGVYTNTSGSGVIISPNGHIITNYHVIDNAEKVLVTTYENENFEAKVIGKDEATDIAVLKINKPNSKFVLFGDSNILKLGEWIMLIGNPFKLRNSVSVGIVSAKNRTLNILGSSGIESYIQTDAMANPGNSGGGMFNENGDFVGMISAISTNTGSFEGYSFAIPSNIVKKAAFDIINYGVVQRAWLGVSIKNIEGENGVIVERVNSNGAADDCGINAGDKILSIEGVRIFNVAQFEANIANFKPGDLINIEYVRAGEKKIVKALLKNNLNTTDLIANRKDDILIDLGFVLRDLTTKEKREISDFGVMVVSVINGTKISNINIEPGYIIKNINGEEISNVNDFIQKYKQASTTVKLKGIYKSYPGIFPYVFEK